MRGLFFLIIVLSFFSCKKEATRWQTKWLLPVLNDTLNLTHLYNDSTLSIINGQIEIDLSRTILDLTLADLVQIPDTTISQVYQSNFTVNNVTPGFVFVNTVKVHDLELGDIQLKQVRVQSGQIQLKVYNPLNTAVIYQIQLPGVTQNGQVFTQNYTVAAGTVQNPTVSTENINLSGYDIDLGGLQGLEHNKLQSKLTLKTDPNGPSVSIYNNQEFKFEASFENLRFDYAKGFFGSTIISGQKEFTIPFLDKITSGTISFPDLSLDLHIENGFKMALRAQIEELSALNTQGQAIGLSAPSIGPSMFLAPAVGSWNSLQPSTLDLHFDQNNSNIKSYLENLGAFQQVSYQLQPNPWGNTAAGHDEAFAHSHLRLQMSAQMPMALNADGLSLQDTFDLNFSQDLQRSHITGATAVLTATNAFPLACEIVLYFMKDGQIWHTVVADAQLSSAALGQIDPLDGLLKKKSKINILLPSSLVTDLQELNEVVVSATFSTTDPNSGMSIMQSIQANAFLALQMQLQLQTQMRP